MVHHVRQEIASRVHTEPNRGSDYRNNDHGPDHGCDTLRTAAARRVVGGVIESGLHRFTKALAKHSAQFFPQRFVVDGVGLGG